MEHGVGCPLVPSGKNLIQLSFQCRKRKGLRNFLQKQLQRKSCVSVIQGVGQVPSQAGNQTWHPHGDSGFRVMKDTEVNGMWIIPPCLRGVAETRSMAGESLHWDLGRPLLEIVKMKPGLLWRSHDIGGASTLGCLQWRAANKKWKQPKREMFVGGRQVKREDSPKWWHQTWNYKIWSLAC